MKGPIIQMTLLTSKPLSPAMLRMMAMTSLSPSTAPTMTRRSSRKAPSRCHTSARRRLRSTPSGVIRVRRQACSARFCIARSAMSAEPLPRQVEIGAPESEHDPADRIARPILNDQLAAESFEQAGPDQHQHHSNHGNRRSPARAGDGGEARALTRKDDAPADPEAGRSRQNDGENLRRAVDRNPAAQLEDDPVRGVEREEGSHQRGIHDQEHDGRHAKGEAERKAE